MLTAKSQGPLINSKVPSFELPNYKGTYYTLSNLHGDSGLLLGFIGDIWNPTSIRRVLWLQRHVNKFALLGMPIALLVQEPPSTLYGFQMSSPLPVSFPIIADEDGDVHMAYDMADTPGLLLIDRGHILRDKWMMSVERAWPRMNELVKAVQHVQAYV